MKKIVIIGAGGNSKVIVDLICSRIELGEDLRIIGILDDDTSKTSLKGYPILHPINKIESLRQDTEIYFVNGIGDNGIRKHIYEKYQNVQYYTAIHPSAVIGSGVFIGEGTVIMAGTVINADTNIGKHVLVNTGAILEHDNLVGDFVHIASGTVTAGNVQIGEGTMLGTGTRVIQGLKIGKHTMIGAGAVVIRDIPDSCTAVGVPAKVR